jgi:hypothetical protein
MNAKAYAAGQLSPLGVGSMNQLSANAAEFIPGLTFFYKKLLKLPLKGVVWSNQRR